ncbi:hypothetical protein BOFE_06460 [Candidatus Borrelia fainii]|nr:hypothetical protein BOFE_06460 [Candidatus Borrelia fainii]
MIFSLLDEDKIKCLIEFIIMTNNSKIKAVENRASLCVPDAYPISIAMFTVSVLIGENIFCINRGEPPPTIKTAIVSPIALPIASITPAKIPFPAEGIITLYIVCQSVAASARDASLYDFGTALSDVYETLIIVGSIIMLRTITEVIKLYPKLSSLLKVFFIRVAINVLPKKPYTTLGIPAKSSIMVCNVFW